MILAIPVVDGHELTKTCIQSILDTTTDNLKVVIFDNGSDTPYDAAWVEENFPGMFSSRIDVINSPKNVGYYQPLEFLLHTYEHEEQIGLVHNDMVLYEDGWNERIDMAFVQDPQLGLIGLCGSNEIDALGGRGGGTMCFFRGGDVQVGDRTIKGQSQSAGLRITDLQPACVLDSLFMMFRRDVIQTLVSVLEKWSDITLAHFYDRIWPCRVIEAGYRVAVMGVDCDHLGGMTTTGNERYRQDCINFLEERNIPYDNPETEMYLIAERRFLGEYRDQKKFLPCKVGQDYGISHFAR